MGFCFLEGNFFREIVQNSPKAVCIINNGAKLGDATVARAPPLLCPPRIFYNIKWGEIPRNSPSPSYSAPALFGAHWRQCLCGNISISGRNTIQIWLFLVQTLCHFPVYYFFPKATFFSIPLRKKVTFNFIFNEFCFPLFFFF